MNPIIVSTPTGKSEWYELFLKMERQSGKTNIMNERLKWIDENNYIDQTTFELTIQSDPKDIIYPSLIPLNRSERRSKKTWDENKSNRKQESKFIPSKKKKY